MDLFAFRRPCPAKGGVSGKQKKDNPLRSLRLCGELLRRIEYVCFNASFTSTSTCTFTCTLREFYRF